MMILPLPVSAPDAEEHLARGADDQVHVVLGAGPVTLCGRSVLVVYDHHAETTCSACSRKAYRAQTLTAHEPCG